MHLTTDEIHLLGVILTGRWRHKDVCIMRARVTRQDSYLQFTESGLLYDRTISRIAIQQLAFLRLIFLRKPSKEFRHTYDGVWHVNKSMFKAHPQYNEVRAQHALGTGEK